MQGRKKFLPQQKSKKNLAFIKFHEEKFFNNFSIFFVKRNSFSCEYDKKNSVPLTLEQDGIFFCLSACVLFRSCLRVYYFHYAALRFRANPSTASASAPIDVPATQPPPEPPSEPPPVVVVVVYSVVVVVAS